MTRGADRIELIYITVRPRLARQIRRGHRSRFSDVTGRAEPGDHVRLSWHSDVLTSPGRLDWLWPFIEHAAHVDVLGGRLVQRIQIVQFLESRGIKAVDRGKK